MNFLKFEKRRVLACLAAGMTLLTSGLLGGCGGGEQDETFQAQRVVVFGDRASTINPDGSKYTVNADTIDCATNQIWVQAVAAGYGISLCGGTATAVLHAGADDTVDAVRSKIDTYLASESPSRTDLVTIYVGTNDIVEQFKLAGAVFAPPTPALEASMLAAVRNAGTSLGQQVSRVTATGAKVLVMSQPDLSYTPFGRDQIPAGSTLLRNLSIAFNDGLRLALGADPNGGGRSGALVEAFDLITLFTVNANNQFGTITDATERACGASAEANLPAECNVASSTVTTGSASGYTTWLWASDFQLTPMGHALLGSQALTRLRRNPL